MKKTFKVFGSLLLATSLIFGVVSCDNPSKGVDGTGVGEQIILSLPGTTTVHGILLYNGYLQTDDLHTKNGRVTRVSVDFGNGVVVEEDVWDPTMYVEDPIPSRVELDQSVKTDKIVITILDAQSGTKYDDTCIGEIIVY